MLIMISEDNNDDANDIHSVPYRQYGSGPRWDWPVRPHVPKDT